MGVYRSLLIYHPGAGFDSNKKDAFWSPPIEEGGLGSSVRIGLIWLDSVQFDSVRF